MKLSNVLNNLDYTCNCTLDDIDISGIQYDSRQIEDGNLFIAIKGFVTDGHQYIKDAISRGAQAILVSNDFIEEINIPQIKVEDTIQSMALIAQNFYKTHHLKLKTVGITGTNGKTTISYLLRYLNEKYNLNPAIIGTLGAQSRQTRYGTILTTPLSLTIHQLLATFEQEKVDNVYMEVSSIALDMGRLDQLYFDAAVFTNLSQDHLDYHKTFDNYFKSKTKLFHKLRENGVSIINIDDDFGRNIYTQLSSRKISVSLKNKTADYYYSSLNFDKNSIKGKLHTPFGITTVFAKMIGTFNAYNIALAIATLFEQNSKLYRTELDFSDFVAAAGRMEIIQSQEHGTIIIDFAHSPDAMEKVFDSVTGLYPDGNIYCVFGAGGNRDTSKRPLMGQVAEKYATAICLTSDNPRWEEADDIISQISQGISDKSKYTVIEDREQAIIYTINKAQAGDLILILGKGGENYQEIKGVRKDFNDYQIVKNWLENHEN